MANSEMVVQIRIADELSGKLDGIVQMLHDPRYRLPTFSSRPADPFCTSVVAGVGLALATSQRPLSRRQFFGVGWRKKHGK
jgi:hypothetical protein